MEIGRWFHRDIKTRQERINAEDQRVLGGTLNRFQGNSKEEVFDLSRSFTLVKISLPIHTMSWYEQPTHELAVRDLMDTLINFNEPLVRDRAFGWVAAIMEMVLASNYATPESREGRMDLVRAGIRGLTMFAPYESTVTFDGTHFVAEQPKPQNFLLPAYNKKFIGKEFINYTEKRIQKYV